MAITAGPDRNCVLLQRIRQQRCIIGNCGRCMSLGK
jgi:hypothetical protein